MMVSSVFTPPRRKGLIFHGALILALGAASAFSLLFGLNQQVGGFFVLLMMLSLLLFAPLPLIIYRAYALARANYRLERDGIRLRWGLRAEDIPLPEVEWVRRPSDLASDLPLPPLRWPGALLGMVNAADLGPMEYLASNNENLLLIATPQRVYAISPEDPNAFLRAFQQTLELGSLTPISSSSVLPAAYLVQVWADRIARNLLAAGFILNLLLFVGIGLIIPGKVSASMGFDPNGMPLPGVPAEQMLLLPLLGGFIYLVDLTTGLFFYRRGTYTLLAYIIWGSAVTTAFLLITAVLLILFTAR